MRNPIILERQTFSNCCIAQDVFKKTKGKITAKWVETMRANVRAEQQRRDGNGNGNGGGGGGSA